MTALEQLLEEIAIPLEASWYEETYDLALAATLSGAERDTLLAALVHTSLRGNHRGIRTLVRLGERARIVAALIEGFDSEFYSSRMRAWDGLVEAWELMPRLLGPDGKRNLLTRIENLKILISCDIEGFTRLGIAEMRELLDRLAAGETPESLGIAWEPDPAPEVFEDIRGALFDLLVPFPLEAIAKLTGGARRMAETMIAMRLEKDDPRVASALRDLGATWALECVPELQVATLTIGGETYEVRSGLLSDAFFLAATGADLAVTQLPRLVELIEAKREETAQALCARRGEGASVSRVAWALRTGSWPQNGDVAEEAAAFAHHVLRAARLTAGAVGWEYRGHVVAPPEREDEE